MNVYLLSDGLPAMRGLAELLNVPHGPAAAVPPDCRWLICWSGAAGMNGGGIVGNGAAIVLNPPHAVRLLADARHMARRLRRFGIACAAGRSSAAGAPLLLGERNSRFIVPVFQSEALAVLQPGEEEKRAALRAPEGSVRLGDSDEYGSSDDPGVFGGFRNPGAYGSPGDPGIFDFARLGPGGSVGLLEGRDTLMRRFRYGALREAQLQPALARKLGRYAVRAIYASGLDFGCVELRLLGRDAAQVAGIDPSPAAEGRLAALFASAISRFAARLSAEDRRTPEVVLGADPEFILLSTRGKVVPASRYLSRNGTAGCDSRTVGAERNVRPLAELRPEPSGDPAVLIRNLRKAMWSASVRITDRSLVWLAGGMPVPGLPLGGHVHFSGIYPTHALIRALDNFLALPLAMIEDGTTVQRRKRYGRLGDIRLKPHGGFEYRTLPSWISSPSVAKGVLALAKVIAVHYRELQERPLDRAATLDAYMSGDKAALENVVKKQWQLLEKLEGYRAFAGYLDPLKKRVMERRCWDERHDFRKHWRIPPYQ